MAWVAAGARRIALTLANALAFGDAPLALGRWRLGAAMLALHFAVALGAPALAAYSPPLDWSAWWSHLALGAASGERGAAGTRRAARRPYFTST